MNLLWGLFIGGAVGVLFLLFFVFPGKGDF